MSDHQIPAVIEYVAHITLVMRTRRCSGKDIARHGVMPQRYERVTYTTRELTSYENTETISHEVSPPQRRAP